MTPFSPSLLRLADTCRTDWPILSLKHDDIAHLFLDRMTLEYATPFPILIPRLSRQTTLTASSACEPTTTYTFSDDASSITSVTVSAIDNTCDVPVPVTFPQTAAVRVGGDVEVEQIGNEPIVLWVTLAGEEVSFSLDEPISL